MDKIKTTSNGSENSKPVDMSPEAITRRLETVEALRALCISLSKAKPLPKPDPT